MTEDKASFSMEEVSPGVLLHCVVCHPNQPSIVATGSNEGVLSIWDLRNTKHAVSHTHAHGSDGTLLCTLSVACVCETLQSAVWDIQFHPAAPDNIVSCGEDGCVLLWDFNARRER